MNIKYRPDIDGLRAISIIAVIFYHAPIKKLNDIFGGGYIGVDIFFVISGYLITSIIYKELIETGNFSFKNFYERRVRRIIPPLVFVCFITLPIAWYYLLPFSIIELSKSIIYSLGFSSNFYFYFSGQEYGAPNSLYIPFLHTWSLSVEEQYYIIFPILFLLIFKYINKYILHSLLFFLFLSLIISQYGSKNFESLNFYILPTRAWELILGSIIAHFHLKSNFNINNKFILNFIPFVGLFLIFYSFIYFNNETLHPSIITLIPTIGISLIIMFFHEETYVTKILTFKPLVFIGLISYSLYLFHYPIFAIARYAELEIQSITGNIVLFLVIINLSLISYFFIEKPSRNKNNSFKIIFSYLSILTIIIISITLFAIKQKGNLRGHPLIIENAFDTLNYRKNYQDGNVCHNRTGKEGFCIYNEKKNNKGDIILLGDSLTDALLSDFIDKIKKTDFRLIHMSYSGNLYLPGFVEVNKKTNKITQDELFHKYRQSFINQSNKNTYVIVLANYSFYFKEQRIKFDNQENIVGYRTIKKYIAKEDINLNLEERKKKLKEKFKSTLKELTSSKNVLLLYPIPQAPTNVLYRIKNNNDKKFYKEKNYFEKDKINYKKRIHIKFNEDTFRFFNNLNFKNLYKINLTSMFCPNDKCIFYDNNNSYFFDEFHPSFYGSKKINSVIIEMINKIEKGNN